MLSQANILGLTAFFTSLRATYAGLDTSASSNLAIYWGQNSFKGSGDLEQQRLSYYCDNPDIDVLLLSFATRINGIGGAPEINFANQGDICEPFEGTNLLNCPEIAEDIATCQGKGKSIILSIGGATYSEGGFDSEENAIAGANLMWETFGPRNPDSSALRPFGDSSVDGFDLDFEAVVRNMVPFSKRLRELMAGDSSKTYFLTAAPQCPYPDQNNDEMLNGAVNFDAIMVQFYNNYCGLNAFEPGAPTQENFNLATWDDWAKTTSANPNVKVLVGAPANTGAAGTGYVPADTLAQIIDFSKGFGSFGGVMLWDATQAYGNEGFIGAVKGALTGSQASKKPAPRDEL